MAEGYVSDSAVTESQGETWNEGKTLKSVWACLTANDKRSFEVMIYRCASCGYLELYATVEK